MNSFNGLFFKDSMIGGHKDFIPLLAVFHTSPLIFFPTITSILTNLSFPVLHIHKPVSHHVTPISGKDDMERKAVQTHDLTCTCILLKHNIGCKFSIWYLGQLQKTCSKSQLFPSVCNNRVRECFGLETTLKVV